MSAPKQLVSVTDGVFLTVGMILGALIFKAPSTVAGATSSSAEFLLAWLFGGVVSLCGALVYAELASRHPDTGGEYMFLTRGFGKGVAFLFAWSRMTVIQTGAIVAVAFVFGDYASEILNLGPGSPAIWAAIAVASLTLLNVVGTLQTKLLQKVMETGLIASLVIFSVAAIVVGGTPKPAAGASSGSFGFRLIFVLLSSRAGERAAAAGRDLPAPRRRQRRDAGRIQRHGRVYVARVLDLLPADGVDPVRFPPQGQEGRARRRRLQGSALSGNSPGVLRHVRL